MPCILADSRESASIALADYAELSICETLVSGLSGYLFQRVESIDDINNYESGSLFEEPELKRVLVFEKKMSLENIPFSLDEFYFFISDEYTASSLPKTLQKSLLKLPKFDSARVKGELQKLSVSDKIITRLAKLENYQQVARALEVVLEVEESLGVHYLEAIEKKLDTPLFWLSLNDAALQDSLTRFYTRVVDDEAQLMLSLLLTKSQKLAPTTQSRLIQFLIDADAGIKSGLKASPSLQVKLAIARTAFL